MYWKNDKNEFFRSIGNLKNWLEQQKQTLVFAMNGGMFTKEKAPLGLYIEKEKVVTSLDTTSGAGNFYLRPNGVFYITRDNMANICTTENFPKGTNAKYATQSGPMLVIEGNIHSAFTQGSTNVQIRNGVGLLPNGNVIFTMSKEPINFYDFAMYFKKLGCTNALYLDGFVSRTYAPNQNWIQTDGNFGVLIGISKDN